MGYWEENMKTFLLYAECSIICLWLEGNISSPVRYSYLSIFTDDNAGVFATYLLISYCNFSYVILSSIVMISLYSLSEKFFLKHKGLSDVTVASVTKKIYGSSVQCLINY